MDRIWMYSAKRADDYLRGEINKFINAADNHTRNKKTWIIHCPCKVCNNLRVITDSTIIRSHMLVSSSLKTRVSGSVPREQISVHDRGNLQSKIINLLRIIHVHTINVGMWACRFLVGGVVSGAYFIVQELLWFAKRMKVKSLVVVCCGMIFRSWRSFFFFFHRLCAS